LKLKKTGRRMIDPFAPAPTHDVSQYAQWLRERGALQADFDARVSLFRDSSAFPDKAKEWCIGYDSPPPPRQYVVKM